MSTEADTRAIAATQGRIADFVTDQQDSTFGEAARDSVAVQLVLERLVAAGRRELARAARDVARAIGPIGSSAEVQDELAALLAYAGRPRRRTTPLPAGVASTPALGIEVVDVREIDATIDPDPRTTRPVRGDWDRTRKPRGIR